MTAQDDTTLAFYARQAGAYVSRGKGAEWQRLDIFLSALRPGARIMELGRGAGWDSEYMIARGFDVVPTDGTPEIVTAADWLHVTARKPE